MQQNVQVGVSQSDATVKSFQPSPIPIFSQNEELPCVSNSRQQKC